MGRKWPNKNAIGAMSPVIVSNSSGGSPTIPEMIQPGTASRRIGDPGSNGSTPEHVGSTDIVL